MHRTRTIVLFLLAPLLLAAGFAGCSTRHSTRVLEPSVALARLAEPGAVLLDVRKAEDAAAGHIAGAARIELSEWSDRAKDPRTAPTMPGAWSATLAALNIGRDTPVIIYDAGRLTAAAAAWFILQAAGAENATIVNGGYPALAAADPALVRTGAPAAPTPAPLAAPARPGKPAVRFADRSDTKAALGALRTVVLDVRSADEFTGVETMDNPRVGHIPGAVSLPHTELYDDKGRMLPPDQLRARFQRAGLSPSDRVLVHCQGGGRASFAALALVEAGFGRVDNYYASFGDWAKDSTCPVVTIDR